MVLTQAQTTAFFEVQMGLNANQRDFLDAQGITEVSHLNDFVEKDFNALQSQSTKAVYLPGVNAGDPLVVQPGCNIAIMSAKKLAKAADGVRFYEAVGVTMTPGLINYDAILKSPAESLTALADKKDNA